MLLSPSASAASWLACLPVLSCQEYVIPLCIRLAACFTKAGIRAHKGDQLRLVTFTPWWAAA